MLLKELGGAKVVGSGGIVFCGVGGMFGVVDCDKMSFGCVESDFNMGEGGGFVGSGRRRVQRCWSVCADGLRVAKGFKCEIDAVLERLVGFGEVVSSDGVAGNEGMVFVCGVELACLLVDSCFDCVDVMLHVVGFCLDGGLGGVGGEGLLDESVSCVVVFGRHAGSRGDKPWLSSIRGGCWGALQRKGELG